MSNNPFINEKTLKIPWRHDKSFPNCRIIAIPEAHVECFEEVFERVGSSISWVDPEEEKPEFKLKPRSDEEFLQSCNITTK